MSGDRPAILVVDDNEDNRYTLIMRLTREGWRDVVEAKTGRQALELLAERRFDLVLLDIMMPEMNGYEVLEQMKSDIALRDVPVIMISAVDEIDSVVRCIELGAEDYLSKPFNAVLLRARIGACLEKKKLRDQEACWARTLEDRVVAQVEEIARMGRLRRFLSPQIADVVLSSGADSMLKSHRREVTVAFCDMRGFTSFSEIAEPEEVMAILGEYHSCLGELIFKHGGTLERFAGDGLLILFNDPIECPDHTAQAVRMALEMRDRMQELTARWQRLGYELGFGVGISRGFVTLGPIGFDKRQDYAAIGTTTNLASRLCDEAKPGQILISQRVFSPLEATLQATHLGTVALKGFHRPVPVYEVLGWRGED